MPFNGTGQFTQPYNWTDEANNGNDIDPAKFQTQDAGVAAGLSNTVTRDGQSAIIADIPWNNNKITGLKDATSEQDALNRRTADARYPRLIGGGLSPAVSVSASTIDLSQGRSFYKTASSGLTWVFDNPAATGNLDGFILELTNGGVGTQTWPASVRWPNGVAPSLTTSGTDLLVFITRDGGLIWRGNLAQRNSS